MSSFKGKVAIVGIGEVPTGKFYDRPCLQNAVEACKMAIQDAGINKNEIDFVMPTGTFLIPDSFRGLSFFQRHTHRPWVMESEGLFQKTGKGIAGESLYRLWHAGGLYGQ